MIAPRLASTAVLVRERQGDEQQVQLETLLLLRNHQLAFAAGAWVFPGGKIETEDYPGTDRSTSDWQQEYRAAVNAVVRETREETGLIIPAEELIHIAHWTTPPGYTRRYATWFFLCPVRVPAPVEVDRREIIDHQWVTPHQALAMHAAGSLLLTRPTVHTLTTLAEFSTLATLCPAMRSGDVHVFPEDSEHYPPMRQRASHQRSR